MNIRRLTVCKWDETGRTDTVVEKPTWQAIEAAIRAMNGCDLNDVYLDLDGKADTSVTVGGGSGKYIVSGSLAAEFFPTLTDPALSEHTHVALVVGGQLGEYPACHVVSLEHALEAVRSVAESGAFGSQFLWTYV